jgi:AraC family transcriptional regulator, alkane utilization regulator
MDALSHVLSAIRLTGAVFVEAELRAGWSYLTPPPRSIGALLMPEAEHIIPYHLITEGSCRVRLLGGEPVEVRQGDLIVFPHGDRHVLASSEPGDLIRIEVTEQELHSLLRPGEVTPLRHGNEGQATRLVCGYLACDRRLSEPILAGLPRLLQVSVSDHSIADWVRSSVRFSVAQSKTPRPGGMTVLAKLSELLFVEAIRHYVETLPSEQTGWFAGLRDRFVGRALALLHGDPNFAWTVDELAKQVGLSRSALADRFGELLGQPPMQYLTQWRLSLAAQELLSGQRGVAQIAHGVGYDSEAAFNRAFKRVFGVPPATWRKTKGRMPQDAASPPHAVTASAS